MSKLVEIKDDFLAGKDLIHPEELDADLRYAISYQRALQLFNSGIINMDQFKELDQLNRETFHPKINQYRSQIVDTTGTKS